MNLIYFLDYRFARTPCGATWTDTSYEAAFWDPYLAAFDHVTVVSRVRQVEAPKPGWRRVDSSRVSVTAIPYYLGPIQYLMRRGELRRVIREVLSESAAVMLRTPSPLANFAYKELKRRQRPFAVEVVGDANAAFAPGVIRAHGRALFRWMFTRAQREQCAAATAATYVARCLQKSYPPFKAQRRMVCSDVRLEASWLREEPRIFTQPARHLVTIATFSQSYKGLSILIDALAVCHWMGVPLTLTLIGDGKLRSELEDQASGLGLADFVTFRGALPWGEALIEELDRADLFVLPSRVEALPRALIEAMARSLPCVATKVGAVPELLEAARIAIPGDTSDLASRILTLAQDPEALSQASARNLRVASGYALPVLQPRWTAFYQGFANAIRSVEVPTPIYKPIPIR